jgi:hypothetical protein
MIISSMGCSDIDFDSNYRNITIEAKSSVVEYFDLYKKMPF